MERTAKQGTKRSGVGCGAWSGRFQQSWRNSACSCGDESTSVLKAVVEKKIDEWVLVGRIVCLFMTRAVAVFAPSVSGLGRMTIASFERGDRVGAPPHWQPISLRSIGYQCGEALPCIEFLQTHIYTTSKSPINHAVRSTITCSATRTRIPFCG